MFDNFSENRAVCEIMSKNVVETRVFTDANTENCCMLNK
jgi:hypothetical protein